VGAAAASLASFEVAVRGRRTALADGQLRFTADEEAVARAAIALGQARIGITALIPETASLEELFLGLTGGESSDHDREEVVA